MQMSTNSREKGRKAEDLAVSYLVKNDFKILQRNYAFSNNFKGGEIDIIAVYKNTIHFIEVKARETDNFGLGRESVTRPKQQSIRKMATHYLATNKIYGEVHVSFDVIEISNSKVDYFENCF